MRFLGVLILSVMLTGCGVAELYVEGVKYVLQSKEQKLDELTVILNSRLGKSKADYIREKGPFASCTILSPTEEVCVRENIHNGTVTHTVLFTYDKNGIATKWKYF